MLLSLLSSVFALPPAAWWCCCYYYFLWLLPLSLSLFLFNSSCCHCCCRCSCRRCHHHCCCYCCHNCYNCYHNSCHCCWRCFLLLPCLAIEIYTELMTTTEANYPEALARAYVINGRNINIKHKLHKTHINHKHNPKYA